MDGPDGLRLYAVCYLQVQWEDMSHFCFGKLAAMPVVFGLPEETAVSPAHEFTFSTERKVWSTW